MSIHPYSFSGAVGYFTFNTGSDFLKQRMCSRFLENVTDFFFEFALHRFNACFFFLFCLVLKGVNRKTTVKKTTVKKTTQYRKKERKEKKRKKREEKKEKKGHTSEDMSCLISSTVSVVCENSQFWYKSCSKEGERRL